MKVPAKTGSLGGPTAASLSGSSGWVGEPFSVARGLVTGPIGGGTARGPLLGPVLGPLGSSPGEVAGSVGL